MFPRKDAESFHELSLRLGKALQKSETLLSVVSKLSYHSSETLQTEVFGYEFKNPLGIAAGFDKNAEVPLLLQALGFGFLEIGSVTYYPSRGNPRPRIWKLAEDKAIVNRMGLPSDGARTVRKRLAKNRKKLTVPLGCNVAKSNVEGIEGERAVEDVLKSFGEVYGVSDFLVLNLSCPSVEGGRMEEDLEVVDELCYGAMKARKRFARRGCGYKPVLLKLSPDQEERKVDELVSMVRKFGLDGYVICNATRKKESLRTSYRKVAEIENGGVSGKPLKGVSNKLIGYVRSQDDDSVIVGVGGVFTGKDVFEKILYGADLVEVLTGFVYRSLENPLCVKAILKELEEEILRNGFKDLEEAKGYRLP